MTKNWSVTAVCELVTKDCGYAKRAVSRELTPDDKPETTADKKPHNQLFGDDILGATVC